MIGHWCQLGIGVMPGVLVSVRDRVRISIYVKWVATDWPRIVNGVERALEECVSGVSDRVRGLEYGYGSSGAVKVLSSGCWRNASLGDH